jgi:Raf kinase inhibitor-like YbhB/YbcL family protein
MKIKSSAFENGGVIPHRYSRYGEERTPPLDFVDVPPEARSLVLIMDDPDAPSGLFTHWIVFNIDGNASGFRDNRVPDDVRFGENSWGESAYGGPRPPNGEHRYFLRLYALDARLDLPQGVHRAQLERAMEGRVLAKAELMGRYATPVTAGATR